MRRKINIPKIVLSRAAIVVLATLVALLAIAGLLTMTRGTPVRVVISAAGTEGPPAVRDPLFARTMELFTGLHLDEGNDVTPLLDGDGTYPVLWRDLHGAKRSITMQMYYSLPGEVADSVKAILTERARAGIRVLVLLDAFGSQDLTGSWRDSLIDAGVAVALLRPLHWYSLQKATHRSHVRVVTVDGAIGYTGGFGIADYWLGAGHKPDEWRETNVRFSGPAVHALQAAFAIGWAEATGELLTGGSLYPPEILPDSPTLDSTVVAERDSAPPSETGPSSTAASRAGLLFTQPTDGSTEAERFLALAIAGSRSRLWITNAYFVPDDDFRRLLERAARRGVDVRILTVSDETDVKTTRYAGRARYDALLSAGVRIYEFQPAMIHAKTIVADGVLSTIGSMNFDNRSLAFNNESSLVVLDQGVARTMEETFLGDLEFSREIRLESFRRRGTWERMLEQGATLLSRIL